jgi:hypothetical protein
MPDHACDRSAPRSWCLTIHRHINQNRTFTPMVPMHKHTVGRALEHTRGGQLRQARLITAHGPVDLDLIVNRRVTRTA